MKARQSYIMKRLYPLKLFNTAEQTSHVHSTSTGHAVMALWNHLHILRRLYHYLLESVTRGFPMCFSKYWDFAHFQGFLIVEKLPTFCVYKYDILKDGDWVNENFFCTKIIFSYRLALCTCAIYATFMQFPVYATQVQFDSRQKQKKITCNTLVW